MTTNLKVYRVFDTETEEYWRSPKGKHVWMRSGTAKNSWNTRGGAYWKAPTFNDQTRYVIHEFDLVRTEG